MVLLLLCGLCWVETAQAQTTDNHRVTVRVNSITVVQVSSALVTLTIDGAGAVAGQDLMTAVDQSTNLLWGINRPTRKITARTSLAAQTFTLRVLAIGPTQGTAAAEVTLTTAATDFLLDVGKSSGTCAIRYTGLALASQGTGSNSHTVTFTIAAQ